MFVSASWCQTRLEYMSNMTGALQEAGIAYPSRAPVFSPCFLGSVLLIFLAFSVYFALVIFVLCLVRNVYSVSGLSILDCPFGFLYRYVIKKHSNISNTTCVVAI